LLKYRRRPSEQTRALLDPPVEQWHHTMHGCKCKQSICVRIIQWPRGVSSGFTQGRAEKLSESICISQDAPKPQQSPTLKISTQSDFSEFRTSPNGEAAAGCDRRARPGGPGRHVAQSPSQPAPACAGRPKPAIPCAAIVSGQENHVAPYSPQHNTHSTYNTGRRCRAQPPPQTTTPLS
jgi:hypothetical protein